MKDALANDVVRAFAALLEALEHASAEPVVLRARKALENYRLKVTPPSFCWHCGKPVGSTGCKVGGCPIGADV